MKVCIGDIKPMIDDHFIYEGELTMETRVMEDLGADSFDIPILTNALEDLFKITISNEEIINLKTLGDLILIIENKIS